jgi:hypothetical protein
MDFTHWANKANKQRTRMDRPWIEALSPEDQDACRATFAALFVPSADSPQWDDHLPPAYWT